MDGAGTRHNPAGVCRLRANSEVGHASLRAGGRDRREDTRDHAATHESAISANGCFCVVFLLLGYRVYMRHNECLLGTRT